MQTLPPIRLVLIAGTALCASLSAQTPLAQSRTKPNTTTLATPLPVTQPAAPAPLPPPPTPAQQSPQPARVTFTNGTLSVAANNSSLNQILREISHQTGIKITGGVADERVFGQYGPDSTDQVLASLLNGTGGNMLILRGDGTVPSELILTPRNGGATPPNPHAAAYNDEPEYHNPSVQQPPPEPAVQAAPAPNPNNPAPTDPNNGSSNTGQPQSPNGVRTPQQIYDELQRLRTQQQQQQTQPQ